MENEPKPSYYSVTPAEVRYNSSISMGARFLYGEITALSNKKGYCWAENKYFAGLYETTTRTIANWIAELKNAGYISYEIEQNNTRKICLIIGGVGKNFHTPMKKSSGGYEKNFQHSIYNNTDNNTDNILADRTGKLVEKKAAEESLVADFNLFWSAYPRKVNKRKALAVWKKINPDSSLRLKIIHSVEDHKNSEQWRDAKYIPHPTTFLNGERWEDEVEMVGGAREAIIIGKI